MFIKNVGNIIEKLKQGEEAPNKHFNPYLKEALAYEGTLLTTAELEAQSRQLFSPQHKPVVIEIGCYLGKNLIEMAHANPQTNFLGLDITYKRVVKSARKIKAHALSNAFVGICDGSQMLDFLNDNSLRGVCVFFPDPWVKTKQQKNRLLNESFFKKLVEKLEPGGFFWFKTDHHGYYLDTQAIIQTQPLLQNAIEAPPHEILGGPFVTMFEKMFKEKNLPTYEVTYFKTAKTS